MGLLTSKVDDPDFGTFRRSLFGPWTGTMSLEANRDVEIRMPGSRKGPEAGAVSILKELPNRFAVLQMEIQQHLYEHYTAYREAVEVGEVSNPSGATLPVIDSLSDVWRSTKPIRVIVESTNRKRLEIAFEVEWDEEHVVGATVEEWKVIDFSGSVGP